MGKKRAYPETDAEHHCRGSALLLGMGAGGVPWGQQATGLMPAALGRWGL
jgi:hypothetical protein